MEKFKDFGQKDYSQFDFVTSIEALAKYTEEADATLAKLCQENQKMQKRLDSSKPGDFPAEWFSAQYGHLEKSRRETGKIQLQLVQKKLKSRDLQGAQKTASLIQDRIQRITAELDIIATLPTPSIDKSS